MVQPNEESYFQKEVKGNKLCQERKDTFKDTDEWKDNPVRQPLRVFQFVCRINGFKGHVGGINEGHEICEQFGSTHGKYEGNNEQDGDEEEGSLSSNK